MALTPPESGLAGIPNWREAPQALKALKPVERVEVRRAVALGREIAIVRLAQVAVAQARWTRNAPSEARNRWLGMATLAVGRGWTLIVAALLVSLLAREVWFLVGLGAVLVVGLVFNTRSVLRHAARAEELNLAFLRQAR